MPLENLLASKINDGQYRQTIGDYARRFSPAEQQLLQEILHNLSFDAVQAQALVHAVIQQSRFDPNADHIDDEEDLTGVCPHCINPPAPPLRDYYLYRAAKEHA